MNRGSQWRKWDLHIHTPVSICQQYGGEAQWEKFIQALENLPSDVSVIGITDYYFIDGYEKVIQYKASGRLQNIEKIFPILEFRIDTFGSGNENKLQKINLHILFDIDESDITKEIDKVKSEFISQIPITKLDKHKTKMLSIENFTIEGENDLQKGFSDLIPSTEKVFELINSVTWINKTFLFLGYKEWSNLEKNNQLKPLKEDLYKRVQAFFTSNYTTYEKSQTWLIEYGNKRLLHSGDIHSFKMLDTANVDSEGNTIESKNYSCNTWIKADPTFEGLKQIIYEPSERVLIQEDKPDDKLGYRVIDEIVLKKDDEDTWEQTLYLNENLNTIIGGRATGKSTLLSSIANKFGEAKDLDDFIKNLSNFISIKWKDDGAEDYLREVQFFPQSYMYELARNEKDRNVLINKIIEYFDTKKHLKNYDDFLTSNRTAISHNIANAFEIQKEIDIINETIKEKGDETGIKKGIETIKNKIKESKVAISEEIQKEFERVSEEIVLEETRIDAIIKDLEHLNKLKEEELFVSSVKYSFSSFSEELKQKIEKAYDGIIDDAKQKWQAKILRLETDLTAESKQLKNNIFTLKKIEEYKKGTEFLEKNQHLLGLNEQLKAESKKIEEINEEKKKREDKTKNLEDVTSLIVENVKKYKERLDSLVSLFKINQKYIKIEIKYRLREEEITLFLSERLNQKSSERQVFVNSFSGKYSDNIEEATKLFLDKALLKQIEYKGSHWDKNSPNVPNELLTTNWFEKSFQLTYQGDIFEKMSQGKQSFVILKLLLEFSEKECPILIDQPEDSLDNRAIYNELVKYLVEKKKVRQIILVTHNSNVVVSADAEQVIVANQHGEKSLNDDGVKFQYISGSLENTKPKKEMTKEEEETVSVLSKQGIREHVCEILEGGNEAFKKREKKYGF